MTKNLSQSRPNQSVSGEQSLSSGIGCLSELEKVKPHLLSESDETRIAVLSQALKFGKPGKEWVFEIVKTETGPVQWAAYELLWNSMGESARHKLLPYLPLRSDVGVDYTRLRSLLAAGQWKEADEETRKVMIEAARREKEGLLDREASETFPSTDLRTINQLWEKFSKGRFGFTVQKRIWESIVGNAVVDIEMPQQRHLDNHFKEHIDQFGDRIGWSVKGNWLHFRDLTFDSCAPEGHLPSPSFATPCDGTPSEKDAVVGRWCVAFCFGGVRCGVLFLGWWSLLSRSDL
ncbi:MAG: GUN4 domain-containing protein [Cyanobacteriota bacterium]